MRLNTDFKFLDAELSKELPMTYSIVENNMQQFLTGYLPSDVTGNKIAESSDGSVVENNYGKMISKP